MSQQRQSTNPIKTTNHILPLSFTNANNTQPQLYYSSVQAPPNYQQQLQQLQQLQQQQQQQQHFLQQVAAPYQRQPQYTQFIPNSTNSILNQQQQQQQQQQYFRNQAFVNTGSNPNAFFPLVNQSTPPYASNIASPTFFHQQQQLLPTTPSSTSPATTAAAVFMRESESASNGVDDWLGVGADDNVEYDFTVATEAPALSTNATSVAFKENDAATVKDDAFPGVVPESGTSSHGQAQPNLNESFQTAAVGILPLEQPVKDENPQFNTHSIIKSLTHQPDNLAAVKVANSATPQAAQYMGASNNAPPLSNHMMQVPRFSQYNAFVPASGHAPPVSNPISIMHTIPIDQSPTLRENMVQSNPPTTASPHFAQKFVPSPILPISESPQQMRRGSIATPSAATTTNFAVTNNNDDISSILSSDLDPAGVPVVLPDSPAAEISSMSQQKFTASLLDFMKKRGATVKIPQWCGRKLDLHALYKLVTQVGGMEAVDRTKKWKSVAEKLSLTDAQSRAHTTLRKHYVNLLAPYEEAHYLPYMRFQPHQVTRRPSMQMSQSPPQSQFVAQAQPSLQSPHTQSQVCPPLDQAQRQSHQQLHKVATSFPTTSMTTTSIPVSYSPSPQLQTIPEVTRYPASHMPSPSISEQQDHSMGRIDEVALLRSTSQSGFPVQFQPTVNYAGARNNRFAPYPQQFPTKVQQMQDTRQQQQQLQLQQQQQQLQFQQIQQHRYQQQQIQHQQYQQHQLQQQQLQQQMLLQQRLQQQQQQQQQQLQQQRQHQQQQQMQQLQGADQRKQQDGQPELNLLQQQKQAQQPERMGKIQTDEQTIKQEQQEGQEQEYNDEQVEHLDLQPQDQQQFQHLKQESSEQKQYQDQEQLQQIQGQQRPRQNSLQHQQIYQHLQLSESRNASSPLLYLPQNSASPSSMVEVPTPGIKQEFSPVQQNISPTAGHFAALPRNYSGRPPNVNNPYTPMLRTVESVGGVDARLLEQNTSRPIYPQLQNLGTIDIHATTMSLKSGLALEVSSALNKLLAISAHPNVRIPFVQCPLLLEALLDILHQGVPRLSKNPMPLQVLRDMVEEENTLASLMVDEFTEPESRSTLSGEEDEDTKRGGRSLKAKREQWVAQALAAITILRNLSMEVAENPAILAGHQRAVPLLARCLVCDAGGGIYTFGMEESEETMKSEVKTEQADDKVGTDGRAEDDRKDSRSAHGLLGLPTFPSLTAKSNDNDGMDDASDLGIGAGDALEFRKSALTILDTAAAHLKLRCTADATFFMNRISDFVSFALQSQQLNTSFGDSPAETNDDGYGDGNTYYAGLAIELYGKASVSDENRNAISGCEREILRRAFRILADSLLGFPMERVEACANPRNTYPFSPPFFSSSTATVLAATVELARLENLLTAIHNTVLLVDDSIIEEMSQYPYFVSCLIRSAIFPRFRSSNAYASQQAYRSPSRSPNPIPPSPSLDTLPVRRRAMATLAQMSKRTGSVRLMHGDAFIAALMDPAENDKPDPEIVAGLLEVLYPGGI